MEQKYSSLRVFDAPALGFASNRTDGTAEASSSESRGLFDELMQMFADPYVNRLTHRAASEIARLDGLLAPASKPTVAGREGRSHQFNDGRRNGVKACAEWLHAEALAMNDPHARAILNTAALGMGVHFKRGR